MFCARFLGNPATFCRRIGDVTVQLWRAPAVAAVRVSSGLRSLRY
jgi:hypothetical protein